MSVARSRSRPVACSATSWREIVVRARNLDTEQQAVTRAQDWVAGDAARRRTQLIDLVTELYPDARLKSFSGSVASFVAGVHLVVVSCGEPLAPPEGQRSPEDWEQRVLFPGHA